MKSSKHIGMFEAAKMFGVAPNTIKNWIKLGKLKAAVTPTGHKRIMIDSALALKKECGL